MPTDEATQRHAVDRPRNRSAAPVHSPSVRHKSANLGEKNQGQLPANPEIRKGYKPPVGRHAREDLPVPEVSPMEILSAYFQHERPSGSRMVWLEVKLLTAERKLSGVRRALRDE